MANLDQANLFAGGEEDVRPGSTGHVVIPDASPNGFKVLEMRWGLRPPPGGKPWTNVRAEGRLVPPEQRCIVHATGEYINVKEGPNRGRWLVSWPGEEDIWFAGVWQPERSGWPAAYAIITCAPGPDLAPYEDRQKVYLAQEMWGEWLSGRAREEDVLKPLPAGTLKVTRLGRARGGPPGRAPEPDTPLFRF